MRLNIRGNIFFIFAINQKVFNHLKKQKSMKNLKNVVAILAMAFGLMITQSACTDPCKNVECNNGTCEEGTCKCDVGYEGTNCDTEERAKFLGQWRGNDNCDPAIYTMTFASASGDVKKVNITNPGGYSTNITISGTVSGSSLEIPSQTAGGATWSGNGSITDGRLDWALTIDDGTSRATCSGRLSRP
jgi:hypothetical protein